MPKKSAATLLYLAMGTRPDTTTAHLHLRVYKRGRSIVVESVLGNHRCPTSIQTAEQIKREIASKFNLEKVTLIVPGSRPPA